MKRCPERMDGQMEWRERNGAGGTGSGDEGSGESEVGAEAEEKAKSSPNEETTDAEQPGRGRVHEQKLRASCTGKEGARRQQAEARKMADGEWKRRRR